MPEMKTADKQMPAGWKQNKMKTIFKARPAMHHPRHGAMSAGHIGYVVAN